MARQLLTDTHGLYAKAPVPKWCSKKRRQAMRIDSRATTFKAGRGRAVLKGRRKLTRSAALSLAPS